MDYSMPAAKSFCLKGFPVFVQNHLLATCHNIITVT